MEQPKISLFAPLQIELHDEARADFRTQKAPARRVGIEFDETVLAAILAEAHDQPGALPLLQYALMELFDARSGSKIERQAFDDIGGVLGALPRRADEIYVGLSPAEQAATRQLFLRLVTLGEGVEDTRRRVLLSELETLTLRDVETAIADPSFDDIVNQFGTAHLLTFDHDPLMAAAIKRPCCAADDGTVIVRSIVPLPVDEILAHIADNRVLRDFTCVERKQFRILPLCDADGVVPESSN